MKSKHSVKVELMPKEAERYAILCNLIETLWYQRLEKDYYNVDLDDLIPFTSTEARRIANFIDDLYQK